MSDDTMAQDGFEPRPEADKTAEEAKVEAGVVEALATENADLKDRLLLAHGLKGSARGVGAFAIADCATEIERQPEDGQTLKRLGKLIDEVRDFIAAINR